MKPTLSLMAKDEEDLQILSVYLQDAILLLKEVRYLPEEKKFIAVLNRFRWEAQGDEIERSEATYERVHTGLCIEHVTRVASKGIDMENKEAFLSLLALHYDHDNQLEMVFAGGGVIRMNLEKLSLFLQDLDQSWPTKWRPLHDAAGKA